MSQFCKHENVCGSYIDGALSLPFLSILHIILFVHCCLHLRHLKELPTQISILFMVAQLVAIWLNVSSTFHFVIGPKYYKSWPQNLEYCYYSAFESRILIPLFYFTMINVLIYRLDSSFKGSIMELSQRSNRILQIFSVMMVILVICYVVTTPGPCLIRWNAFDINETFYVCVDEINSENMIHVLFMLIGGFIIISENIILALLFVSKLRRIVNEVNAHGTVDSSCELKTVMIKNTILSAAVVVSSGLCMSLYLADFLTYWWVHIDLLINCILMAMMYHYNDKYYQCCCKLCIWCINTKKKKEISAISLHNVHRPLHLVAVSSTTVSPQKETNIKSFDDIKT